ncbi:MAG: TetR/AcrR family transcriptional regulator [Solirubrobacterales bacterium]|nr:TetR/AcrR family transcriptional regulator [Solirubrobacterales bacterium]
MTTTGTDNATEDSAAEGEAPRRADAVRNREKVIAAAEQVFAEHGVDAGIPEIAERAGVGKGTVYRNFESKDDLVAAILTKRMARFEEDINQALESDDPGAGFREVLQKAAARASDLSFPAGIYWAGKNPELDEVKARTRQSMAKLVEASQAQGTIRADALPEEVWVLFGGLCRTLGDAGERSPEVWRRHTDLVIDAFRP